MDQDKKEMTFEESVIQLLKTLPPPVRSYLVKKKHVPVIERLTARYGLHIDQSDVLERETILLLMGTENPTEFEEALISDGEIPRETVGKILADINTEIFIPLQQQMRESAAASAVSSQVPVASVVPDKSVPETPIAKMVMQHPSVVHTAAPIPPQAPQSPYRMPEGYVPPVPSAPIFRTGVSQTEPVAQPAVPPRIPQPAPHADTTVPASSSLPPHALRPTVTPPPQAPGSSVKEYPTDPYREPIE